MPLFTSDGLGVKNLVLFTSLSQGEFRVSSCGELLVSYLHKKICGCGGDDIRASLPNSPDEPLELRTLLRELISLLTISLTAWCALHVAALALLIR